MKYPGLLLFFLLTITCSIAQVQWACRISETTDISEETFGPRGAVGVPNVYPQLKVGTSWLMGHLDEDSEAPGEISIKLQFCKPMLARQVFIVENLNPGAIKKVILYDVKGQEKVIYDAVPVADTILKQRVFSIKFEPMEGNISAVKLIGEPSKIAGSNCIDAVGISESLEPLKLEINLYKDEKFLPTIHTLPAAINTSYDEFAPIISPDGKTLYFGRLGHPENVGAGKGDIDIWYSTQDGKAHWTPAKNIGTPINNKDHNIVVSAAADGNTLLLGNTYNSNGSAKGEGASISNRTKNGWSKPENLKIQGYANNHEHVSFFLANNEKVLLMGIEDNNQSFGEQDIYVSFLQPDGIWSEPSNLGSAINTVNSENNMFLAPDGVSLYFMSNGYTGYGGFDVYLSRRLDDTWKRWTTPLNLGPIVNTVEDELSFVITADGKFAYGYKYIDEAQKHDIYIIGLPVQAKIKPEGVVAVSGKVLHSDTKQPIGAKIIYQTLPDGKEAGIAHSNPNDGSYEIILPKGKNYGFMATSEGFVSISENITVAENIEYVEMQRDLLLVPIEVGKVVKLNNIFFERNMSALIDDSYPELDNIATFLEQNPTISIRLDGHTDNQGSPEKMLELSEKRVEAVRDYLISKNINPKRLSVKAFGGSKPVASNTKEDTRKLNRRVEFVITQK